MRYGFITLSNKMHKLFVCSFIFEINIIPFFSLLFPLSKPCHKLFLVFFQIHKFFFSLMVVKCMIYAYIYIPKYNLLSLYNGSLYVCPCPCPTGVFFPRGDYFFHSRHSLFTVILCVVGLRPHGFFLIHLGISTVEDTIHFRHRAQRSSS